MKVLGGREEGVRGRGPFWRKVPSPESSPLELPDIRFDHIHRGAETAHEGELAEAEDAGTFIMGCSCAMNAPGGGATVNAEVQGVALATLLGLVA